MNDRYLFKAKRKNWKELQKEDWWVVGLLMKMCNRLHITEIHNEHISYEIDESTLCQCTGLKDKNGTLIWKNDILMCNNNPKDLAKAVFGEFSVIDADSLSVIDKVVGWHYEVIPTDELSKCVPFCLPMPLTEYCIERCNMKVIDNIFDNPELLEVE